jgi:hypothetical protein
MNDYYRLLWPRVQQAVGEDVLDLSDRIKTISNIELKDIREHYRRTHTARNMMFVIAGKIRGRKHQIMRMLEGWNLKEGEKFYCSFPVSDGARMITESDISNDVKDWNRYYLDQTLVTTFGFLVVTIVMLILRGLLKETSVSYRLIMSLLVLWVLGISSLIGYRTYTEYRKSIEQMCESMERTVLADLKRVHENGIDDENITGMDDYLKRYVENISEIDGVSLRDTGDGCVFHLSKVFLGRVKVDYIMQAFLLLAFSVMILTEYHLFVSGIHLNEEEDDYG